MLLTTFVPGMHINRWVVSVVGLKNTIKFKKAWKEIFQMH